MPAWPKHPQEFSAGEHLFEHVGSTPSTIEVTTYDYRCRYCRTLVCGKYLYDDERKTAYSFRIITALDALEFHCGDSMKTQNCTCGVFDIYCARGHKTEVICHLRTCSAFRCNPLTQCSHKRYISGGCVPGLWGTCGEELIYPRNLRDSVGQCVTIMWEGK